MTEPKRLLPFPYCAANRATHVWTGWQPSTLGGPRVARVWRKCTACDTYEDIPKEVADRELSGS